jgi:hypothetical protein
LSHDNGLEIVTHYGPILMHDEPAKELCSILNRKKAKSHNCNGCGLHVNISRERATTLQRALYTIFWHAPGNRPFLEAFSRRWDNTFAKHKADKGEYKEPIDALALNNDRYELVNWQPRNRVEVRAFKGTTKYATLMACVDMAWWSWMYCLDPNTTQHKLDYKSFLAWCASHQGVVFTKDNGETVTFKPTRTLAYWKEKGTA